MEQGEIYPTESGTPQGGVISPLLLNVALHGMEEALGIRHRKRGETIGKRALVRYADDFVVLCESKEDAEMSKQILREWLKERGLALDEEKTFIVHLTDGFNFLGFNIRLYATPSTSKSGYKLLIKPSKPSEIKIRKKLAQEWRRLKGKDVKTICLKLNPIIRGWANYFRTAVACRTFHKLDHWLWQKQVGYVKHKHPNKGWHWWRTRYWGKLHPQRQDSWVFGDKHNGYYLQKFTWFKIKRHVMVKGRASPDDPNLQEYWKGREQTKVQNLSAFQQRLAQSQHYICPVCNLSLFNGEELHEHHLKPKSKGGKAERVNLRLVHYYCHQQIHNAKVQPRKVKQLLKE
jgi:RNA-directed DNA polymerase